MSQSLQFAPVLLTEFLCPLSCIHGFWLAGHSSLHHLPTAGGQISWAGGRSSRRTGGAQGQAQAGGALPNCGGHTCTATATVMVRELPVWRFSFQTPPLPSILLLLWKQKETVGAFLEAKKTRALMYLKGSCLGSRAVPPSFIPRCLTRAVSLLHTQMSDSWEFLLWSQPPSLPDLKFGCCSPGCPNTSQELTLPLCTVPARER